MAAVSVKRSILPNIPGRANIQAEVVDGKVQN